MYGYERDSINFLIGSFPAYWLTDVIKIALTDVIKVDHFNIEHLFKQSGRKKESIVCKTEKLPEYFKSFFFYFDFCWNENSDFCNVYHHRFPPKEFLQFFRLVCLV